MWIWVFSKNNGIPKSSILIGFCITIHFGVPLFLETPICWISSLFHTNHPHPSQEKIDAQSSHGLDLQKMPGRPGRVVLAWNGLGIWGGLSSQKSTNMCFLMIYNDIYIYMINVYVYIWFYKSIYIYLHNHICIWYYIYFYDHIRTWQYIIYIKVDSIIFG